MLKKVMRWKKKGNDDGNEHKCANEGERHTTFFLRTRIPPPPLLLAKAL